jgi:hypothetical protein
MFQNATSFNQNIGAWNVTRATTFAGMFNGASSFNQNIGGWNTTFCVEMSYMFEGASSFNQNIGGWNTSLVEYMTNMFYDAPLFDQDLGLWNVRSVTDLSGFIGPVPNALSTSNYNSLLIGWGSQNVQRNVIADFGSSMYTGAASPSKGTLTSVKGWMISDGGLE